MKDWFLTSPPQALPPLPHYIDSNCGIRKTEVNRVLTALTITTVLFSSVFEMVRALVAKQMYDNNVRYTMMPVK